MLSRIMRSPLISVTMFLTSIGFLYLIQDNSEPGHFTLTKKIIFVSLMVVWGLWMVLVSIHNSKFPNDRINVFGVIPAEFREADEGQQWITNKACRNVYVYYSIVLPLAMALTVLIPDVHSHVLFVFGALGLGQFVVYGLTISRYNRV